jgi:hypothetical protein
MSARVAAVAFDTGGTFTDLAMLLDDGSVFVDKVLSTPQSPAYAVLAGIDRLLEQAAAADACAARCRVIGATTVVTNAVLERKGASTALLVTEGFTDVLRIRDESRYDLYDLQLVFPTPLVPPSRTLAVRERLMVDGGELMPVDEDEVRALAVAVPCDGVLGRGWGGGVHAARIGADRRICHRPRVDGAWPSVGARASRIGAGAGTNGGVDQVTASWPRGSTSFG